MVLLKPQTFSDLSGESVLYIASFLKIQVKDIVLIHEDLDLELGQIVVTKGGESVGHPGVDSVSVSLRSPNFIRIRIGVRNPKYNPKKREEFLRDDFEPLENLSLIQIINDAEAAIRSISMGDIDEVIQKYHL